MSAPAPAATRSAPRRRAWWRWLAVVVLAVAGVGAVVLGGSAERAPLDPESTAPEGARALARVLNRSSGVRVEAVRDAATLRASRVERGTTVLVADAGRLSPAGAREVRRAAAHGRRLVLLDPSRVALDALGVPAEPATGAGTSAAALGGLDAACETRDVGRGERVTAPGVNLYRPTTGAGVPCLRPALAEDPREAGGAYLRLPAASGRPETVVLGLGDALTNETLPTSDDADDATGAIALRTLAHGDRVLWYLPDEADGPPLQEPAVVPPWFGPGVVLLSAAALVLCLWRGRRLGPLVPEPLPALVPAVETVHARARLYARSGDAPHALAILQAGTLGRVRDRLGLPPETPVGAVVDRVADALGVDRAEVLATLTDTDVTPARLPARAARLRRLEREVDHA